MSTSVIKATIISLTLFLSGCGGGSSTPGTIQNSNQSPTVNAGADQSVDEELTVALTGIAADSDGSISNFQWTQTSGTEVIITDASIATTSFKAPSVTFDETLTFQLQVTDNQGATATDTVDIVIIDLSSASFNQLNDTGITTCSDGFLINLDCPVAGFAGQDASKGRDADEARGNLIKTGAGRASFDFTKLDSAGNVVLQTANSWICVQDNVTGLIWEVKTIDGGLRDMANSYSWFNPDVNINGGQVGIQNGANCTGSNCDTNDYVAVVNNNGLCGASDWRLPSREELRSIVDYSIPFPGPTIDANFFPNTKTARHWTSSPHSFDSSSAWYLSFSNATAKGLPKGAGHAVRLVREDK